MYLTEFKKKLLASFGIVITLAINKIIIKTEVNIEKIDIVNKTIKYYLSLNSFLDII
jgi:hypothetical protein